jgi:hypothetical protein
MRFSRYHSALHQQSNAPALRSAFLLSASEGGGIKRSARDMADSLTDSHMQATATAAATAAAAAAAAAATAAAAAAAAAATLTVETALQSLNGCT